MPEKSIEIVFAIYITSGIFLILLLFSFVIIYNFVKIKVSRERDILKAVFETAESERNRIADDLHDSLGSNIAVLKMYNELLMLKPAAHDVENTLRKNSDIIDKLIGEIRLICRNQSGKFITDNGIVHELVCLQNSMSGLLNIQLLQMENIPNHLNSDFTIHLFRIIQELLQNAIKHSHCRLVSIEFNNKGHHLYMFFDDDGIGMPASIYKDRSGIKNINGRVKIFNGSHHITNKENKGTHHVFSFPLNKIS